MDLGRNAANSGASYQIYRIRDSWGWSQKFGFNKRPSVVLILAQFEKHDPNRLILAMNKVGHILLLFHTKLNLRSHNEVCFLSYKPFSW